MYTIAKQFAFSASHILTGLPEGHKCGRLHGHNYVVEVILASRELNEHDFVVDYGDLASLKAYVNKSLDHRHLNDVLPFKTTAENLARHLFDFCEFEWPETVAVRVSETAKTWAEYRRGE